MLATNIMLSEWTRTWCLFRIDRKTLSTRITAIISRQLMCQCAKCWSAVTHGIPTRVGSICLDNFPSGDQPQINLQLVKMGSSPRGQGLVTALVHPESQIPSMGQDPGFQTILKWSSGSTEEAAAIRPSSL